MVLHLPDVTQIRIVMKRIVLLPLLLCFSLLATAQRFHVGIFGGLAAYNGELTDKIFPKKVTNGAIGITANYELTDNIMLRGGFTHAIVGGADRFGDNPRRVARNLSFETVINEFSLVGEYYLLNLYDNRVSPYVFAGLAVYHFNPYAYNGTSDKIYLRPLSTEGQGLTGHSTKPYGLTQVAVPLGIGFKFALSDKIHVGVEGGYRKLFTDYLDDVSNAYPDRDVLLAERGQLAVDMSYRGNQLPGGDPAFPTKGWERGSSKNKDAYYFTGIHLSYRIGGGNGGFLGGGGRKSKMGCPTNVY